VYPDEVEQVLRSHPKVEDVMVVKDSPEPENVALKAIIVLKETSSQEELLKFCRSRIATYKMPHLIEFREELPRSWKAVIEGRGPAYPMWGEF
jgi:long-chain acyl-CoA synthetase